MRVKRLLIFSTLTFLLVLIPSLQSSGTFIPAGSFVSSSDYPAILRVDPSLVNVPNGSSFNVTLKIDNAQKFTGLDTVLVYDPSILKATSITFQGTTFESISIPIAYHPQIRITNKDIDDLNGVVHLKYGIFANCSIGSGWTDCPSYSGDISVAKISFLVKESGFSTLHFKQDILFSQKLESHYFCPGGNFTCGNFSTLVDTPMTHKTFNGIFNNEPLTSSIQIPSYVPFQGSNSSNVNMIEFSDYQGPFSQRFFIQTWPQIKQNYVDSGNVKFYYMDFAFLGNDSSTLSEGAWCANEQGLFYQYHDYIYSHQGAQNSGWGTPDKVKALASNLIGINTTNFNSCLDSGRYQSRVQQLTKLGQSFGVAGTPTFFIGNDANGYTSIVGAQSYITFQQAIEESLTNLSLVSISATPHVFPGQLETFSATVRNDGNQTRYAKVIYEVFDSSGHKVGESLVSDLETIGPGKTIVDGFSKNFNTSVKGKYTVIGNLIFGIDPSNLFSSGNSTDKFRVSGKSHTSQTMFNVDDTNTIVSPSPGTPSPAPSPSPISSSTPSLIENKSIVLVSNATTRPSYYLAGPFTTQANAQAMLDYLDNASPIYYNGQVVGQVVLFNGVWWITNVLGGLKIY